MNNTTADLRKTASFAEGAKGLIKKNTMSLALVVVVILIEILLHATGLGTMFKDMNISNLVSQNAYVLILATGMLLCILTGGNIDLSVGSMVCFIGAVGGQLIVNMNANIYVSILCCLAIGLAVGAWQGFWIAYVRIPAFIVTLAGMLIWRGMGWIVLNGYTISPMPKNFLDIFNGFLPGNSPPATALRTALIGAGVLFLVLLILIVVQYVVRLCRRARERKKGHEVKKFSFPIRTLVIGIAIIIVIAAMLYLFSIGPTRLITLIVGGIICLAIIALQVYGRLNRRKKGYQVEHIAVTIIKILVILVVIGGMTYFLSGYKGIPIVLIMLAVIVGAYAFYTSRTVPGRYLYAMGGNEKAAKLSGVNTNRMLFFAYTNMGFLSAFTALVCLGRFAAATQTMGNSYELDAIAACFIGGASVTGGSGTVYGVVIGAILMGVLNNGMSMLHIDNNWQLPIKGFVLLAAVAFDVISKKRARSL